MNITAITKFKQGDIWVILKRLGWSQSELARRTKTSPTTIGVLLSMRKRPSKDLIEKVQNAFAEAGEFLDITSIWPEKFEGFGKSLVLEETQNIEPENLLTLNREALQIPCPENFNQENLEMLDLALNSLPERNKKIINDYFFEKKSGGELAKVHNVHPATIYAIIQKSLGKLRREMYLLSKRESARDLVLSFKSK